MAQHIIRDSKGRVEKILNDKEYAEHQNKGCLFKIFLFIIFIIIVIALAINGENNEGKAGSENAASKESSQLEVSTTLSKGQKEVSDSEVQQPSAETTPLLEADIESSSESAEAVGRESQDIDVSSMTDDSGQEMEKEND